MPKNALAVKDLKKWFVADGLYCACNVGDELMNDNKKDQIVSEG